MSDESIIALAAVITSGIVGVASLWFNFWNASRERAQRLQAQRAEHEERYRATLYDKRLAVHQEAFKRAEALSGKVSSDGASATERQELKDDVEASFNWLMENALYMDMNSTLEFIRLLKVCLRWAEGDTEAAVDEQAQSAMTAAMAGIGFKHIDIPQALRDISALGRMSR